MRSAAATSTGSWRDGWSTASECMRLTCVCVVSVSCLSVFFFFFFFFWGGGGGGGQTATGAGWILL